MSNKKAVTIQILTIARIGLIMLGVLTMFGLAFAIEASDNTLTTSDYARMCDGSGDGTICDGYSAANTLGGMGLFALMLSPSIYLYLRYKEKPLSAKKSALIYVVSLVATIILYFGSSPSQY